MKYSNDGKVWMESKEEMRNRGLPSAIFGDAFCMAFGVHSFEARSYMSFDDSGRRDIARSHGWAYTSEEDDESYKDWRTWGSDGRPGHDDWPSEGFGGMNSTW